MRREKELRTSFKGLVRPLALLACMAALLLAEPDFGAATVLFASGFALLFLAGARLRYVLGMTIIAAAGFATLAMSSSYRVRRLTTFLDPWADPYNSGFQLTQSLIAIGRGEWFGVGLGASVQKLFYLPEAHTDFLFAVLAEELGLVGIALTLALFVGLIWRSFYIARLADRRGPQIWRLYRRRLWAVARHPGLHQHRRQHGRAADQGSDAAAHELRPLEPHRRACLGGAGAARLSRGKPGCAQRTGARLSARPVLIMAGGTGGHVFPALALARLLRERSCEVVWLGTRRGLEARVVPAERITIEWLSIAGLRGKGFWSWLTAPFRLGVRARCRRWP